MKHSISKITVLLFALLLCGLGLAFWLVPDRAFSDVENRALRTAPHFSWHRLASGDYAADVNDYFADQFPLRELWVTVKSGGELAQGKGGSNGVLLGKNGQLATYLFDMRLNDGGRAEDVDLFDPAHVRASGEAIGHVGAQLDVPFSVALAGRQIDVCASAVDYPRDASDALLAQMKDSVGSSVSYIDVVSPLRAKFDAGEYVYYKTDHHWTTRGAYEAYVEILCSFGMEEDVLPPEAFSVETTEDFFGTVAAASGMHFVEGDTVERWLFGNESEFSVIADGRAIDGFYSTRYLAGRDKYATFLDGTHDVVTVTKTGGTARPRLLLIKDSFANSVAPFLAQHFDLILCNLSSARSDFTDVTELTSQYAADRVLLLYGFENVITSDRLKKLH